jgi:hypothetical protein
MSETKTMKQFLTVCVGPTDLADGKVGMILQIVKEDGTLVPEHRVFNEKNFRKANIFVGGMWEIEGNEDFTSVVLVGAKYKGLWPNEADRTRWKTEDRSFQIAREAKKRQSNDKERNAMVEALRPIRDVWMGTNMLGRLAIEVQVLAYIRGMKVGQ